MSDSTNSPATHPLLSPTGQQQLDVLCHSPMRTGNQVKLLASGAESYRYRWELLDKAKTSIHIVAFSMMRDKTSLRLRDVLLGKLKQGVEVKLIVDDAVMWSTFSGGIVNDLQQAGAQTIRYHKLFYKLKPDLSKGQPFKQAIRIFKYKLKRRFHEKYMIIDGTEVILGGINWGNKYAFGGIEPKAWRDSDALLTGPVVTDIQQQFHKDFDRYNVMDRYLDKDLGHALPEQESAHIIPENPATGTEQVRYVAHKPYDDNELAMTNAYLQVIRQAQDFIYWGCHGIRPPNVIADALAEAVERGVDVRLYTNSQKSSQTLMMRGLAGWMYKESHLHFHGLLSRGVRVFEWQKPGAFHSKNMAVDDVFASVGSYNIARGSVFHHTESNIFVTAGQFPIDVRKQFEVDEQDCKEIRADDINPPPDNSNPYLRKLNYRYSMINNDLLPDAVKKILQATQNKD